ncbi:MAG TPA: hypothetical protein VF630_12630 [Hymenobacter sp.]
MARQHGGVFMNRIGNSGYPRSGLPPTKATAAPAFALLLVTATWGGKAPQRVALKPHFALISAMLKTLLFVVGLALTAPVALAQTAPAAAPATKAPQYQYCMLVLNSSYFDGRDVRLEFGQSVKNTPENPELVQANAVVRKLASVVVALNYMSSQGWECINVSTLSSDTSIPDTGYLLRRAK